MKRDKNADSAELRIRAEEQIKATGDAPPPPSTELEALRMVNELQVHQIELEMQNEQLKRTQVELETGLEKYTDLFEFAPAGYFTLDRNGVILQVNLIGTQLVGMDRSHLLGKRFGVFVSPETRPAFNTFLEDAFASQNKESCDVVILSRTGSYIHVQIEAAASSSNDERRIAVLDITERKLIESSMRLHSAAINAADDAIAILDRDGRIVFVNSTFQRQTGYSAEEAIGLDFSVLRAQPDDRRSGLDAWIAIKLRKTWNGEMMCKTKDGSIYTADATIAPLNEEDGLLEHLVVIARNITERKEHEGELDYQAHHDALTGLPNRQLFTEELARVVADHKRRRRQCAVLFIDLDRFKRVNDTMGHQAGDALLVEISSRLALGLRDDDMLARISGDEYIVLLSDLSSPEDARTVANRMREQVALPFNTGAGKLIISASVGISIYPVNATTASGLLKCADAAMYKAKEMGRDNCQFFSDELGQAIQARVDLESDLRAAIEQNDLRVYYQPIVDVMSLRIVGAEALLRWNHAEKGMISPGLFVPVAEETGMILVIGRMVLETACKQCKALQKLGCTDFKMSVNVSPSQLHKEGFPLGILDIVDYVGLSPSDLTIEITETLLATNDHHETEALVRLNDLGIRISLDDFGIGYSSLSRLKDLPVSQLKVDGSFIRGIEHSKKDKAMTQSMITMAHNLGMKVTAEWIENTGQLAVIKSLGCDYAQGYLISPALSPEALEAFIREWKPEQHTLNMA